MPKKNGYNIYVVRNIQFSTDGVKVTLLKTDATGTVISNVKNMLTTNGGKYNFTDVPEGFYVVKTALSMLPTDCNISPKEDIGDNPTIDATLYTKPPCGVGCGGVKVMKITIRLHI